MSDASPQPGTPPPGTPPPPSPPPAAGDKDALDRLNTWAQSFGAREKAEGKAAIEREVAEKLNMTVDEAATFIKEAKDRQAESLSEAEQKLLKSEEARTEAKRYREEAHDIIRRTLAADALEDLGMPREAARQYAAMVQPQFTQGMNDDARVAAVVAAAGQLKASFPDLFAAPSGNGRQGPIDTATRGGRPPTGQGGETSRDRALARLRERRGGRLSTDVVPAQTEIDATRR